MSYIRDYFDKLHEGLVNMDEEKIDEVVQILFDAWKTGKQVIVMGNGGSAATASHIACDFGKGIIKGQDEYDPNLKRMKVISLGDNLATLTALGNDLSYDDVFTQQLMNLVNSEDVVIVISGSGNSKNILKAAEFANSKGATTIGFLGFDGGKAKSIVNHAIIFNENHYGRAEDAHMILDHLITEKLHAMVSEELS
jgi:D-sedoheptulose 7-phosphate isomerase